MNSSLDTDIDAWEGEGGAVPAPPGFRVISMSRTANPGTLGRAHQAPGERRAQSRGAVIPIGRRNTE